MITADTSPATAGEASNNSINYPILKLIPLSQDQCASALSIGGDDNVATNDAGGDECHIPPDVATKRRSTMCLKLCSESDDVVDVDNSYVDHPEPTRYARMDNDGNYSCELKLGRSEFSSVSWNKISRSLCDIGMTRVSNNNDNNSSNDVTAWIKMRKGVDQHMVHLNGKLLTRPIGQQFRIEDNSIISLFGATGFAYRIKIESNGAVINRSEIVASRKRGATITDNTSQPNYGKNQNAKRHKHPGVLQDAHSLIENSTECPLCCEIFVKTVAIHPCGHNFCEGCAETHFSMNTCTDDTTTNGKTECPICRGLIQGFTRNRLVDSLIWAVALNGCFDRDDASSYLKRRENAKMDAPTDEQKECILRCAKGEQEGIMSGNHMNEPVFMEPKPLTSSTKKYIPTLPPMSISQARAKLNNHSNEVVDLT
jgi:hypothetical protein